MNLTPPPPQCCVIIEYWGFDDKSMCSLGGETEMWMAEEGGLETRIHKLFSPFFFFLLIWVNIYIWISTSTSVCILANLRGGGGLDAHSQLRKSNGKHILRGAGWWIFGQEMIWGNVVKSNVYWGGGGG